MLSKADLIFNDLSQFKIHCTRTTGRASTPVGVFGKCHSDLLHALLPLDMQLLYSKVITTANMKGSLICEALKQWRRHELAEQNKLYNVV